MDGWKWFDLALGGLCVVLWWLLRNAVVKLENCVTKNDLDKVLSAQAEQYTRSDEARERQHGQNQQELQEIRRSLDGHFRETYAKIDENKDAVHAVAVNVAALQERTSRVREPNNPSRR